MARKVGEIEISGRTVPHYPVIRLPESAGDDNRLRSLHMRFRNTQRSSKATAVEKFEAELAYRDFQLARLLDQLSLVHLLRSQTIEDLDAARAAEERERESELPAAS